MNPPRLLSQTAIRKRLREAGFSSTGRAYNADDNTVYSIWISEWGEPIMVPEEGPDKRCAEWVFQDRLDKVLATKPKAKK